MRKYELHGASKILHWVLVAFLILAATANIVKYLSNKPAAILAVIVSGSILVGVLYRRPNAYAVLALLSLYAVSNNIRDNEIMFAVFEGTVAAMALLVRHQLTEVV